MNPEWSERDERQRRVAEWVCAAFGEEVAANRIERVARILEEAAELAQAEGLSEAAAYALIGHVFSKPAGSAPQEVGGIGVTLLAYCALAAISADDEERREVDRVTSLPADHFRRRQNAKAEAGVAMKPSASS